MRNPAVSGLSQWSPGNNQEDPLGIAVQSRAREARMTNQSLNPGGWSGIGPLPDPQWEGFFQSLSEQAPGGIKASRGGNPLAGLRSSAPMPPSGVVGGPYGPPNAEGPFGQFGAGTGGQSALLHPLRPILK